MLSISSPLGAGQQEYYADLASEDYYLEGGEPPGEWLGEGAEFLGLLGRIDNEQFRELFTGFLNGEKLVQNAGTKSRVPGWDLTFSAPKSVSTAWSQAGHEIGQEIRAAHHEAVEKALRFLEQEAGFSRTGKKGAILAKAILAFATFEHGTSRAQEPQLHTHCILMNVGIRQDGTTGTLYMSPIYKHKMAAGALYRAELAYQLIRRLDLKLERDPDAKFSFRLKGGSRDLEKEFSTRRREVEDHLQKRGLSGAVASAKMAVFSRSNKAHAPREQLSRHWAGLGRKHGFTRDDLERLEVAPAPFSPPVNGGALSGFRIAPGDLVAARDAYLYGLILLENGDFNNLPRWANVQGIGVKVFDFHASPWHGSATLANPPQIPYRLFLLEVFHRSLGFHDFPSADP